MKPKFIIIFVFIISLVFASNAQAQSVPDMLERAITSVVTIGIEKTSSMTTVFGAVPQPESEKIKQYIDKAYDRFLEMQNAQVVGSGYIIEMGGKLYVITNAHVVEIADLSSPESISAYTPDQKRHTMKFVGGDTFFDLAVLEFTDPTISGDNFPPLPIRTTPIRVGETVYAIGNPLGAYPFTVTSGIVGALNRGGAYSLYGYLQHNATISHGNSGGPLIDKDGQLVGMNSTIGLSNQSEQQYKNVNGSISGEQMSQLNFALEAPIIQKLVQYIVANKSVERFYLGCIFEEVVPAYGVKNFTKKLRIGNVIPNSPAAIAGLDKMYEADLISVNGREAHSLDDILFIVERLKQNEVVTLVVTKDDERANFQIQPVQYNSANYFDLSSYLLKHFLNVDAALKNESLTINYDSKSAATNDKYRTNTVKLDQADPYGAKPLDKSISKLDMTVLGIYDQAEARTWKITNPKDFILALRLSLLYGHPQIIQQQIKLSAPGDYYETEIRPFSGNDGVGRCLIY